MASWAVYPARCFLSIKYFFVPAFGWFIVYCQTSLELCLCLCLIHLITFYISFSTVLLIFFRVDSISRSPPEKPLIHYAPHGQKKQKEKRNNELKSSAKKPFQWHFQTAMHGPRTQPFQLFQAAGWFGNVLKVQNLPWFVFFKTAQQQIILAIVKFFSNQNNQM